MSEKQEMNKMNKMNKMKKMNNHEMTGYQFLIRLKNTMEKNWDADCLIVKKRKSKITLKNKLEKIEYKVKIDFVPIYYSISHQVSQSEEKPQKF